MLYFFLRHVYPSHPTKDSTVPIEILLCLISIGGKAKRKKIKIKSAAKVGGWHSPKLEKNQKTTA